MGSVRLPPGTIRRLEAEGRLPAGEYIAGVVRSRALRTRRAMGVRQADGSIVAADDWPRTLAEQCRWQDLPVPVREHSFHPTRGWRFDLAWPDLMVACEVDGGVYVQGRHTSGAGFEADCEKLSEAAALGWRVLRVTPRHVRDGRALGWLERALGISSA